MDNQVLKLWAIGCLGCLARIDEDAIYCVSVAITPKLALAFLRGTGVGGGVVSPGIGGIATTFRKMLAEAFKAMRGPDS